MAEQHLAAVIWRLEHTGADERRAVEEHAGRLVAAARGRLRGLSRRLGAQAGGTGTTVSGVTAPESW